MKKYTLFFILLIIYSNSYSQKELWGVFEGAGINYPGAINKFDINGQNPTNVHEFDVIGGSNLTSKLFLASNGKLYGVAESGGTNYTGVIFEYDLTLNKFRVVYNFESGSAFYKTGFIEPIAGKLYMGAGSSILFYDILLETVTFCDGLVDNVIMSGELMKASNGFLYGTTSSTFNCPNTSPLNPNNGTVFKFNTTNNTIQTVYRLSCNFTDGSGPTGSLIEASPGKLYGTTIGGSNLTINAGTLFEFDINTNIFTLKKDFDEFNIGKVPYPLVNGGNGKLYGVCRLGGTYTQFNGTVVHFGTLFEYSPANNTITKLHDFGLGGAVGFTGLSPISIMKTSTGKFMITSGVCSPSVFDPMNNNVALTCDGICNSSLEPGVGYIKINLIEICRKPSYQEFIVNTFSPAVGTAFTFNVNNTNAATYVWKKGTTVLPTQSTGVLNLPSVSLSDTGVYTCTMTNECGITITTNLNINVTNLSVETVDDYKQLISLYPNPTKGILNLKFPENRGLKGLNYKVTNLLGQVVIENDISKSNKTELAIDTSSFANGVYQLTLVTDKGNWNGKFVKE